MEAPVGFQDWELLQSSDTAVAAAAVARTDDSPRGFDGGEEDDSDNGISPDYFALDSNKRYAEARVSEDESLAGSDNPSWIDPNSDSWYSGKRREELGFGGIQLPCRGIGGSWSSDESSDEHRSPNVHRCKVGFGGIVGFAEKYGENLFDGLGEDVRQEESFGGVEEDSDGVEAESESSEELCSLDGKEQTDKLVERKLGSSSSENVRDESGEKSGTVWWKLPLELLKFYAFKVRPVWSISLAAAVMGFIMLGRKLYKLKRKSRSIPIKIGINDKKASQFMVRATRLNEAFSVVKRMPIIKTALPTPGVTPWPAVALR